MKGQRNIRSILSSDRALVPMAQRQMRDPARQEKDRDAAQ